MVLFVLSCRKDEDTKAQDRLTIINSYSVIVKEPSGLVYDKVRKVLYAVSDNTNRIYKLSKTGSILQEYSFIGNDLEGITIAKDGDLLVVEERKREVIKYNTSTEVKKVYSVGVEENDANSGLEGICYTSEDNTYFVLNEKNPGLLLILNQNFVKIETYSLSFANDFSGICYDRGEDVIWIVSDQSKTLTKCDKKGNKLKQYNLSIDKAEGIALDEVNKLFYIVSDSKNILYEIEYPN